VQDLVKEKGAVIFAYPKANTPGCTKQAIGFRDNYADIDKAGIARVNDALLHVTARVRSVAERGSL
jgi:peroxiredoxin